MPWYEPIGRPNGNAIDRVLASHLEQSGERAQSFRHREDECFDELLLDVGGGLTALAHEGLRVRRARR